MAFTEFTWFPDVGSNHSTKPNVRVTKFGDGYELRTADGINNNPTTWSLKFERSASEMQPILSFLKARGALEAFLWTSPLNEQGTYVCRQWKVSQQQGTMTLNADFEQVFEYSL